MADPVARRRTWLVDALARIRVPLGFVFAVFVYWLAQPTARSLAAGGGIALVGEALRFWAAGHLRKSAEVTSSGPYRWLGHPLYVGSSIIGLGLAVASARLAAGVIIAAYLGATLTAAIVTEEAFLRRRFGEGYDRYRGGGGGSMNGAVEEDAAGRRFSFAQAMRNREHRAAVGFAVVVLLLVLKATYNGSFWRAAAGP